MSLVGIDWSRNAFHAFRLDAVGRAVDRRSSFDGLRKIDPDSCEETLFRHVGPWLDADTTLVIATSVADRRGWVEPSFLNESGDLAQLLGSATRRRLRGTTVIALPGIARRRDGATDLMRREALIALGATAAHRFAESDKDDAPNGRRDALLDPNRRLFVLPGQHSRWIRILDGRIVDFRTSMGGELLDLLQGGAFNDLMSAGRTLDDSPFLAGVEQGHRTRHLVTDLFAERAARLLDERDSATAHSHLIGLLLGNEIREAEGALCATGEALTLIGDNRDCMLYARALRHLGTTVTVESRDGALIAGFARVQSLLESPQRRPSADHPASSHGRMGSMPLSPANRRRHKAPDSTESAPGEATIAPPGARPAPGSRRWDDAFAELPLVACLRNHESHLVIETSNAVVSAGFRIVVVSAKAVDALESVRRLVEAYGDDVCIGVTDVPTTTWLDSAIFSGARAVLSRHADASIARRCRKRSVAWIPGISSANGAATALSHGARALLLLPADSIVPQGVPALQRLLPKGTALLACGGMTPDSLLPWIAAGAAGAVADTAIYKPGTSSIEIASAAHAFVGTWLRIERGRRKLNLTDRAPSSTFLDTD